MASKNFREMLAAKQFITAHGVFDLISARVGVNTSAQNDDNSSVTIAGPYLERLSYFPFAQKPFNLEDDIACVRGRRLRFGNSLGDSGSGMDKILLYLFVSFA